MEMKRLCPYLLPVFVLVLCVAPASGANKTKRRLKGPVAHNARSRSFELRKLAADFLNDTVGICARCQNAVKACEISSRPFAASDVRLVRFRGKALGRRTQQVRAELVAKGPDGGSFWLAVGGSANRRGHFRTKAINVDQYRRR
jgi:hypothetical protein